MVDTIAPTSLLAQFDGTNLEDKLAVSAVLATVAEDGWPHVAYLGAGEVLAASADRLRVRLWPGSGTAANLRRSGRAALHAASEGAVWELRLETVGVIDTPEALMLDMMIGQVVSHRAPYAEVLGMVGFALKDEVGTLERWRAQIAHLRSARAAAPAGEPQSAASPGR